jgi:hypothetical protein
MRLLGAALALALSAASASAQTPEDIVANMGLSTCAIWLSTPAHERDGQIWLYGFWSGLNHAGPPQINLGPSADLDLLIAEMHRICQKDPTSSLVPAALRIVELSRMGAFSAPPKR